MSRYCEHSMVWGRCPRCEDGSFRPNFDRFGMPLDYETYVWATYGAGKDLDPARRAFLYEPEPDGIISFGQQIAYR